jgi:hypothetical protein
MLYLGREIPITKANIGSIHVAFKAVHVSKLMMHHVPLVRLSAAVLGY